MVNRRSTKSARLSELWPDYGIMFIIRRRSKTDPRLRLRPKKVFVDLESIHIELLDILEKELKDWDVAVEQYINKKRWPVEVNGELPKRVIATIYLLKVPTPSTSANSKNIGGNIRDLILQARIRWKEVLQHLDEKADYYVNSCENPLDKLYEDRFEKLKKMGLFYRPFGPGAHSKYYWIEENNKFFSLLKLTGDYERMKSVLSRLHSVLFEFVNQLKGTGLRSSPKLLEGVISDCLDRAEKALLDVPFRPDVAAMELRRLLEMLLSLYLVSEEAQIFVNKYKVKGLKSRGTDAVLFTHLAFSAPIFTDVVENFPIIKEELEKKQILKKVGRHPTWMRFFKVYFEELEENACCTREINIDRLHKYWKVFSMFVHNSYAVPYLSVLEYKVWLRLLEGFAQDVERLLNCINSKLERILRA